MEGGELGLNVGLGHPLSPRPPRSVEVVGLYWVKVDRTEWDRLFIIIELGGGGGGGGGWGGDGERERKGVLFFRTPSLWIIPCYFVCCGTFTLS